MRWFPTYEDLILKDLVDSEKVLNRRLTELRSRLGSASPDWGALYELHFLGMSARAGVLVDHAVPVASGRNYDALLDLAGAKAACDVLVVELENLWPHKGFESDVKRMLADKIAGLDVAVSLSRLPCKGVDERVLAELVAHVIEAHRAGRAQGVSPHGEFLLVDPDQYGLANCSLASCIFVRPGETDFTVYAGNETKVDPPDYYSARLRPKIEAKPAQLPDDLPGVIVVGTLDGLGYQDVSFLAKDGSNCIFRSPGFEKVIGLLWFHLGRKRTRGLAVEVVPGLVRSAQWYWNPNRYPGRLIRLLSS